MGYGDGAPTELRIVGGFTSNYVHLKTKDEGNDAHRRERPCTYIRESIYLGSWGGFDGFPTVRRFGYLDM